MVKHLIKVIEVKTEMPIGEILANLLVTVLIMICLFLILWTTPPDQAGLQKQAKATWNFTE